MLWCANLIFTCVFSRIFLHKTLSFVKWFAVFLIVGKFTFFSTAMYLNRILICFSVGVITVGVSDENVNTERNPVLGDTLTIIGMLFWAGQLTYEEKYIKKHNVSPILALGLEGFFGLAMTTLLLIIFYFVPIPFDMGQPRNVFEDAIDGFIQLKNCPVLLITFISKIFLKTYLKIKDEWH